MAEAAKPAEVAKEKEEKKEKKEEGAKSPREKKEKKEKKEEGAKSPREKKEKKEKKEEGAKSPREHKEIAGARSPRSPKPRETLYLRAKRDYQGQGAEELSFKKGDVITFKSRDESGFLEGDLNGKVGFFPSDAVEQVTKSGELVQDSFLNVPLTRALVSQSSVTEAKDQTGKKLESFLAHRPGKDELVNKHILQATHASPALAAHQAELEKAKTKDFLTNFFRNHEGSKEQPLLTEEAIDDLVLRMTDEKDGVRLKTHTKLLSAWEGVFQGREGVDWLVKHGIAQKKDDAKGILDFIIQCGVLDHVTKHKKGYKGVRPYRFFLLDPNNRVMNRDKFWSSHGRDPTEVSLYLLNGILELVKQHKQADGNVDWARMRASAEWRRWSLHTAELQKVEVGKMSKEEKRAFFVNMYNMMALHAFSRYGPPNTMLLRKQMYEQTTYLIGGHDYTLDLIDNWLLRGEVPPTVTKDDPRAHHVLKLTDNYWFFTLSDGTKNTPAFRAYGAKDFDQLAQAVARQFLAQTVKVHADINEVVYPKLVERLCKTNKVEVQNLHKVIPELLPDELLKFVAKVTSAGFNVVAAGASSGAGHVEAKIAPPDNGPSFVPSA